MYKYYLSLAISILFNVASLLLLKKAALLLDGAEAAAQGAMAYLRLLWNPTMIAAVGCFGASLITWMIALRRIDLSLAYPAVSVSYILIALASHLLFDEPLGPQRFVGMGLIMAGVVVMFRA